MGARLSGLGKALYNPKRREFLGRDGAGWGKLGVFYFFFYLGMAGFFCAMLAIFMALTPRDQPRYTLRESRMHTRSNQLAPGLGFRPQPEVDRNLIIIDKNTNKTQRNPFVVSLDQYLQVYYPKNNENAQRNDRYDNNLNNNREQQTLRKFSIADPGECTNRTHYGFEIGKPCVLVKMNKIVDFVPIPGSTPDERDAYSAACGNRRNSISVHCYGEYPADVDNIGRIRYMSEKGRSTRCGSLETDRFPYRGKVNRLDHYEAPYVWVQFTKPKPNVLINVLCRVYGENIAFDKKAGRALTRFQIYMKGSSDLRQSRQAGEF